MQKPSLINFINQENKKKPIGSGLGLAICKQIIEHHKGIKIEQNVTDEFSSLPY
jgi:nitrogen-specific signal transduction histidine kinase